MTPIYQDVRQWLSAQRQANGGQLAGINGTDDLGRVCLLAGVALAAMAVQLHRRRHPRAAIAAGAVSLLLIMGRRF